MILVLQNIWGHKVMIPKPKSTLSKSNSSGRMSYGSKRTRPIAKPGFNSSGPVGNPSDIYEAMREASAEILDSKDWSTLPLLLFLSGHYRLLANPDVAEFWLGRLDIRHMLVWIL